MIRKFTSGFLDHAQKLMSEGQETSDVARLLGCNPDTLSKALRARGLAVIHKKCIAHNKINNLPEQEIISRYFSGESEKSLAQNFNISRTVIRRVLRYNNIPIRSRSDAMFIRMAQYSENERKLIASQANIACRKRTSDKWKASARITAKNVESKGIHRGGVFGIGEQELFNALVVAGESPIRQKAIDVYSIDIVFRSVAVEVKFGSGGGKIRDKQSVSRLEHITKLGLKLAFVHFVDIIATQSLDDIIALLYSVDRKPSSPGQYWVIRSGLQTNPRIGGKSAKFTGIIAPPELVTSIRKINI